MCAISGKIYFNHKVTSKAEISRMVKTLQHRGPDDSGVFLSKDHKVGLGNNRLSIIDLSTSGHQPMTYQNRYTITYNGEVYNFQQQRERLQRLGFQFNSYSDTEVILALYSKHGTSCLNYLRGMFAFAIYDSYKNTIFIARDRIGKKPLKYFLNDSMLVFASELKAILTQDGVKKSVDYNAISEYLTYGYVPAPLTGFSGIKKLEPGHYIFVDITKKKSEIKRYWEPVFRNKLNLNESEWCAKILETLEESTRLRMISDVPIGAFLSGGVDSSAVVATMAMLSTKPIKTFTVAFKDKSFSEEKYAAKISKIYKTDHHVLTVNSQSTEILPFLAKQFEEPFADASSVVTYLVSQLTRKYVTVAINGDGGDENFAGYHNRYFRLKRDVDYDKWIKYVRPFAATLLKIDKKYRNFLEMSKLPIYERFASYNRIFARDQILSESKGDLLNAIQSNDVYGIVKHCFKMFKGKDLRDAGLKFDLLYFLPDQLLTKVDLASMAVSLEARSPFLDQNMIELGCKIPFDLKVRHGQTKYILKKALEKIVPKENLYRPKVGFTIPLDKWFSGKLNGFASRILLSKDSTIRDMFRYDFVKSMVENNNRTEDFGPRIWSLMSLELWLKTYFK